MFLTKKWVLGFIAFIFLLIIFIDQNNDPVPVKLFVVGPYQIPLSYVITISFLAGVGLAVTVGFLIYKMQSRRRKFKMENNAG
ncbi:LapA family protein [bacterium]|nr:LapA family protein [bacterium]